jgi:GT2 family glycosyltransferase
MIPRAQLELIPLTTISLTTGKHDITKQASRALPDSLRTLPRPADGATTEDISRVKPLVSVLIPTHRDMHLLNKSLPVFARRPRDQVEVIVINNDPDQDVEDWASKNFGDRVRVLNMGYDSGFARAINAGIATSGADFLLCCNTDLFADDSYIDVMLDFFARTPKAGSATGKLLRYELQADLPTDVIDTAGLVMTRNRRALVRGEGQRDVGQFDRIEEVFGVDGAAVFIRRSALEDIKVAGEYLDETFFMYKEDWDFSWRLRLAGWQCWYVPTAVAFHGRTSRGLGETGYLSAIRLFHRNEKAKPAFVRLHSMKNQWLMLLKNEDFSNFVRDAPYICGRELMVLSYNAVFAPRTLAAIPKFLRLAKQTWRKRRALKAEQLISPQEMRRWLSG